MMPRNSKGDTELGRLLAAAEAGGRNGEFSAIWEPPDADLTAISPTARQTVDRMKAFMTNNALG
jgi:hypothetical protein